MLKSISALALPVLMTIANTGLSATIFTESTITGDTSILNSGTLVIANDLGAAPSNVTINGVTFGTSQSGLTNLTNGGGDFSVDPFSANLDAILSDLVFAPNSSGAQLNLSGLTNGQDYRLQLLFSNDSNNTGNNINVVLGGDNYHLSGWQTQAINLQLAFTATASTQQIQLNPGAGSDSNTGRAVLNAYAVHQVGVAEPGTLGLMGLSALLFAKRRKQRHA